MKIRDNVQLKARHVELSEQMKELNLENAFMMINVINKRSRAELLQTESKTELILLWYYHIASMDDFCGLFCVYTIYQSVTNCKKCYVNDNKNYNNLTWLLIKDQNNSHLRKIREIL